MTTSTRQLQLTAVAKTEYATLLTLEFYITESVFVKQFTNLIFIFETYVYLCEKLIFDYKSGRYLIIYLIKVGFK